jgi:hypothetical protein
MPEYGSDVRARLPQPRGLLSATVTATLAAPPGPVHLAPAVEDALTSLDDAAGFVHDDDAHLALWVLLELHRGGFHDVHDAWEWHPELSRIRMVLGGRLEEVVLAEVAEAIDEQVLAMVRDPAAAFLAVVTEAHGAPLERHVRDEATLDEWRELLVLTSVRRLTEADTYAWVLPRVHGPARTALSEIHYGEHGTGDPTRQHAALLTRAMAASGVDATYAVHLDRLPAAALAVDSFAMVCGMQRRLLGASLGHLAMREATSMDPHRMYAAAARRLGLGDEVTDYFHARVAKAAVHDRIAVHSVCAPFVGGDRGRAAQVLLGAVGGAWLDDQLADLVLASWMEGRSALLTAAPAPTPGGRPRLQVVRDSPVPARDAEEWADGTHRHRT